MWNLKYDTNEPIYKTETESQTWRTDLWLPRWRHRGGRDWEFGISRYELLHIGWLSKVLLYSTGNYIQYPVINHHGKEYENKCICTYNWVASGSFHHGWLSGNKPN